MLKKNIIYNSILLIILLFLGALPFVKIPISSSSRGIIVPIKVNTKLNAIISGKVIKNNLVKNNQFIKQGDTLLIVNMEQLDTQKSLQNSQRSDYSVQLQDLNKLTKGQYSGLQTGQYQKELSAMQEKIAQVETQLSLAQKDFDRAVTLYNQGVIPKAEYDKYYYDYQGLKRQISGIREQQVAQWQTQKREIERQIRSLGSEVQRINQEQKNYIITAPTSGRLVNFSGVQEGNFLVQGQSIGEISPEQSLVAECVVSAKDIGFIYIGQKVKFQADSYNYNQWGLLEGKVIDIDRNVTVNQQTGETYFHVVCKLDKDFLQLKNGYKGKISKGMTFTARFHLVERTLWQLLFDRVDDWFNPNLS